MYGKESLKETFVNPNNCLKILTKCQVYVILIYSNFSPEKRGTQRGGLLDVTMNYNQITY